MKILVAVMVFSAWFGFGGAARAPEQEYTFPAVADSAQVHDGFRRWNDASGADYPISQIVRNMVSRDWESWQLPLHGGLLLSGHDSFWWERTGGGLTSPLHIAPPIGQRETGGSGFLDLGFGPPSGGQLVSEPSARRGVVPIGTGASLVRSGRRTEEGPKPVAVAVDAVGPPLTVPPSAAAKGLKGLLAHLWLWKGTLIALPGACGLALLFGHLSLRALRQYWNKRSRDGEAESFRLEQERGVQSPFIASLVERENRRAIERARVIRVKTAAEPRQQQPPITPEQSRLRRAA